MQLELHCTTPCLREEAKIAKNDGGQASSGALRVLPQVKTRKGSEMSFPLGLVTRSAVAPVGSS